MNWKPAAGLCQVRHCMASHGMNASCCSDYEVPIIWMELIWWRPWTLCRLRAFTLRSGIKWYMCFHVGMRPMPVCC